MADVADDVRLSRAMIVESAIGSGRLEGLEPSAEAMVIFVRYAEGELTLEEMGNAIDALSDLQYGPVRLPGNLGT